MGKPRMTAKRLQGLERLLSLVEADLDSDPERFPADGPEWCACEWLEYVIRHERTKRAQGGDHELL